MALFEARHSAMFDDMVRRRFRDGATPEWMAGLV
jgi:hypothetical protein